MTREEIIRNLEYTMDKHKNDTVSTFDTNVSAMCKDILDYLKQEPCEDAISRQAVLDDLEKSHMTSGVRNQGTWNECIDSMMRTIRNMPSVTPKQKMGRWIEHNQYGIKHIECSSCSAWVLSEYLVRKSYCPNCGAKMVEPQESEEKK